MTACRHAERRPSMACAPQVIGPLTDRIRASANSIKSATSAVNKGNAEAQSALADAEGDVAKANATLIQAIETLDALTATVRPRAACSDSSWSACFGRALPPIAALPQPPCKSERPPLQAALHMRSCPCMQVNAKLEGAKAELATRLQTLTAYKARVGSRRLRADGLRRPAGHACAHAPAGVVLRRRLC